MQICSLLCIPRLGWSAFCSCVLLTPHSGSDFLILMDWIVHYPNTVQIGRKTSFPSAFCARLIQCGKGAGNWTSSLPSKARYYQLWIFDCSLRLLTNSWAAGPTASTVAGTVPFSVGTETEGSLMSPAATCGATAMRPSLGSIGRSYVMTLADSLVSIPAGWRPLRKSNSECNHLLTGIDPALWDLALELKNGLQDKMGPICRSVADCAVIFDVLRGQDDLDPTSRVSSLSDPFDVDISQMVVGYLPGMDIQAREVGNSIHESHKNS